MRRTRLRNGFAAVVFTAFLTIRYDLRSLAALLLIAIASRLINYVTDHIVQRVADLLISTYEWTCRRIVAGAVSGLKRLLQLRVDGLAAVAAWMQVVGSTTFAVVYVLQWSVVIPFWDSGIHLNPLHPATNHPIIYVAFHALSAASGALTLSIGYGGKDRGFDLSRVPAKALMTFNFHITFVALTQGGANMAQFTGPAAGVAEAVGDRLYIPILAGVAAWNLLWRSRRAARVPKWADDPVPGLLTVKAWPNWAGRLARAAMALSLTAAQTISLIGILPTLVRHPSMGLVCYVAGVILFITAGTVLALASWLDGTEGYHLPYRQGRGPSDGAPDSGDTDGSALRVSEVQQ